MTEERRTEVVRAMMRKAAESARARAQAVKGQERPMAIEVLELAHAVTELSLAVDWLLDASEPRQRAEVNGKTVERAPHCSGCIFPHALCGPCHRWNGRGG